MAPTIHPAASIPELFECIRYSFRECEYVAVRSILMEREKSMKADMENAVRDLEELKKQVDILGKCKGFTELEKHDMEVKLGRSERRVEELQKMTVLEKEIFEQLRREKDGVEEKLLRSTQKCEKLDEIIAQLKQLRSEKVVVEEKLLRSSEKCEELDELITLWKVEFDKLGSEKEDVEEKLVRSSEKSDEMKVRLVEMEKEIEELRRESLAANKTIKKLKAKEMEADCVVQELQRKNAEAVQTIDDLRANKMKSDKAAELYENDLDPRILKLEKAIAKMLNVDVEDLADLANGVDDFAAAATGLEDRVVASTEVPAASGSHRSATAMQLGGEVPTEKTVPATSAAGTELIILSDDSDNEDETSIPDALAGETNKRDRTDGGEDSPMNLTKRRNISTSAMPARCTSLPSRVEERAGAPRKSHGIDGVDSIDLDGEWSSDAYMNSLVAKRRSKMG